MSNSIRPFIEGYEQEEARHNKEMRIRLAAPDMLEALKQLMSDCSRIDELDLIDNNHTQALYENLIQSIGKAKAAIAKAEGKDHE